MKKSLPYFPNLDGMRGIAAMMVVVYHFFILPVSDYLPTDLYAKLTDGLQHGVTLFFVLSGFVITRILMNQKGETGYFGRFYRNRILRIMPLYFLFLACWYFLFPLFLTDNSTVPTPLSQQLPFYLYLQNFDWLTHWPQNGPVHFWTLAVEEHFYLVWPMIVFLLPSRSLKWAIIGIVLAIIPLKILFLSADIPINTNTFTRFDQILLGGLLACFEWEGGFAQRAAYYRKVFLIVLASLLPIAALIYLGQGYFPAIKEVFKYNLLGLVAFSVLGWLIVSPTTTIYNRFLQSKPMQFLGRISYGLYVWHFFVWLLMHDYFRTGIWTVDLLIGMGLSVLVAGVSYWGFERVFLKLKV